MGVGVGVSLLMLLHILARCVSCCSALPFSRIRRPKHADVFVANGGSDITSFGSATSLNLYAPPTHVDTLGVDVGVAYLRLGGSLVFPVMNDVRDTLHKLQHKNDARALVLDFSLVTARDYTAVVGLENLAKELSRENVKMYATKVQHNIDVIMNRSNLKDLIPILGEPPKADAPSSSEIPSWALQHVSCSYV